LIVFNGIKISNTLGMRQGKRGKTVIDLFSLRRRCLWCGCQKENHISTGGCFGGRQNCTSCYFCGSFVNFYSRMGRYLFKSRKGVNKAVKQRWAEEVKRMKILFAEDSKVIFIPDSTYKGIKRLPYRDW
jgi:hypothetical protein